MMANGQPTVQAPQTNTPDAGVLMHKMCVKEMSSRIDLIEDVGRRTGKQSAVNFGAIVSTKLKSAKPHNPHHHRAKLGTSVKQVEKLKRVDCIEAERILYIVEQFLSHLLLIGGLQASLVSEVKEFPSDIIELKKTIISPTPDHAKICDLTRDSLRVLASHPGLCAQLRSHTFDPRFKKLKQLVDELRGSMFNRLTQKQAEADDEIFCIRRTNQRRTETEAQIVKVKSELGQVECEKQNEHDKRQDQINTLKNEIALIEKQCQATCNSIHSTAENKKKRACIESQKVQNQTIDQTRPLELEWKKLITKHREEELVVRGKKFRMETELDNWTNKYDDFMEQQNGRTQAIQEEYDDEKADLVDLRERFATLKEEYDAIVHERQLIREEEERIRREFEQKTFNAQIIQAYFRAFMFKKYAKTGGKRKGKGKGKGKDKKKK